MAITKERIFTAADELFAAGITPTLTAVRKQLGGGSLTTISPAMAEWRERRAKKESLLQEAIPPHLADRLGEFGAELWSAALESANGNLALERAALETTKLRLEAEQREAVELADHLSAELDQANIRIVALETAEQTARTEADTLRPQLMESQQRAAIAEARAAELSKRTDDLNAELLRLNQQHTELLRALTERIKEEQAPDTKV